MAARNAIVQLVITAKDNATRTLTDFFRRTGDQADSLSGRISKIGLAVGGIFAGIGIISSIKSFFSSAIDSARDFEEQLAIVRSKLAGDPESVEAAMQLIEAESKRLGAETRFTATEAAAGFQILAQSGLDAAAAIKVLPTVINVAIGQNLSLAESAKIVTDTMSQMGLSFNESGRAADVLTRASNLANTTVQELQNGLAVASGSARRSNFEFENTVAVLDALANEGLRGAEAGTALRNLLNELRDPASKARKELATFGITTGDLNTVIERLATLGPNTNRALASFTVEAQRAASILITQGIPKVNEFTAALEGSAGEADRAAKIAGDNLAGALAALGSAWDAVQRTIVNADFLTAIQKRVDEVATAFGELVASGQLEQFRDNLIRAFDTSTEAVKQFIQQFDFNKALKDLGEFSQKVGDNLSGLIQTTTIVASSIKIVFNGITAGFNTIAAAVTRLSGYVNDLFAFLTFGETSKNFQKAADKLRDISNFLVEEITKDGEDIKAAWDAIGKSLDGPLKNTTKNIKDVAGAQEDLALKTEDAIEVNNKYKNGLELIDRALDAGEISTYAYDKAVQELKKSIKEGKEEEERATAVREQLAEETRNVALSAEDMAEKVAKAYQTLRIESSKQLEENVNKARTAFATIRDAGTETADDIKGAFLEYAKAVLAANETTERSQREKNLELLKEEAAQLDILDTVERLINRNDKRIGIQKEITEETKRSAAATREVAQATEEAFAHLRLPDKLFDDFRKGTAELGARTASIINAAFSQLAALSKQAVANMRGVRETLSATSGELADLQRGLSETVAWKNFNDGIFAVREGLGRFIDRFLRVKIEFFESAIEVQRWQDTLNSALESGRIGSINLSNAAAVADSALQNLDGHQVQPLRDAIAEIEERVRQLNETIFESVRRTEVELARLRGDKRRAELIELEANITERLARNQELLNQARLAGEIQLITALKEERQQILEIQKLRERDIEIETRERERRPDNVTPIRPAGGGGGISGGSSTVLNAQEIGAAVAAALRANPPAISLDGQQVTASVLNNLATARLTVQ